MALQKGGFPHAKNEVGLRKKTIAWIQFPETATFVWGYRSPIYTPLYQIKPPRCTLLKVLEGSTGSRAELTALEGVCVLTPPLQMGPSSEKGLWDAFG